MRWITRQSRLLQSTQRSFSTAPESLILTETHNGYSIIRLNNPPVNILSTKLFETLDATIAKLESEKSCRGMILASSTPRIFSAGLDLSELYQPHPTKVKIFYQSLYRLFTRLYTTRLACVAAIEGHSPAGGCILAMCCDYRIMATGKAKIGLNETQLGFIVPKWVRNIFINTVGHRQAERLLGLGLQLDAMKAKAVGMVDEACEVDEVLPRSKAAIENWLAIPDHTRVGTKRLMRQDTADCIEETKKEDLETFLDMAQTDKVQKALGLYLEALKNKAK